MSDWKAKLATTKEDIYNFHWLGITEGEMAVIYCVVTDYIPSFSLRGGSLWENKYGLELHNNFPVGNVLLAWLKQKESRLEMLEHKANEGTDTTFCTIGNDQWIN